MQTLDGEPPHVSLIFDAALRVRAAAPSVRRQLSDAGYETDRDSYGLNVRFDLGEDHLSNPSLICLVQLLSSIGVCFARDFKQLFSPASFVEMLIERGVNLDAPRACGFDGKYWVVQDYPLNRSESSTDPSRSADHS